MKCNLVKKSVTYEVKGEKHTGYNYYLIFDNGTIIPVECKYYPVSDKSKDKERLQKFNSANFTKFSTLADLIKE